MSFSSKLGILLSFVYLYIYFFFLLQGVLSVDVFFFDLPVVELQESSFSIGHATRATWYSPAEDFPGSFSFSSDCAVRSRIDRFSMNLLWVPGDPFFPLGSITNDYYSQLLASQMADYEYRIWPVSDAAAGVSAPAAEPAAVDPYPAAEPAKATPTRDPVLEAVFPNYMAFLRSYPFWGLWPITPEACTPVSSWTVNFWDLDADTLAELLESTATGDFPYIKMYNNTAIKADANILHAIEFMETTDANFEPQNPTTQMRMREITEEEKKMGKFIKESPRTFDEKTWGDWYSENQGIFDFIALAVGCYIGYRWYKSDNPSEFSSSSWDS